jgi:hypothetical protein
MKKLLRALLIDASDDANQNDDFSHRGDLLGEARGFAIVIGEEVAGYC